MFPGQNHSPSLLLCSDPDRAGPAHQAEGIVSNQVSRSLQRELDGITGVRANVIEFVSDAEDDPGGVGSVGDQTGIVGQQREFLIEAFPRVAAGDDLFPADVSVDPQVGPERGEVGFAEVGEERRILQVGELFPIGLGVGNQFALEVELQIVAVR